MSDWLPILEYRDFYDLPRAFVVRRNGREVLFDCPFDAAVDDYPKEYAVYELTNEGERLRKMKSWSSLAEHGTRLGKVSVDTVAFDASKRSAISTSVFDRME